MYMSVFLFIITIFVIPRGRHGTAGQYTYKTTVSPQLFNPWLISTPTYGIRASKRHSNNLIRLNSRKIVPDKLEDMSFSTVKLHKLQSTDYRVTYMEDLLQNGIGVAFHDARIHNYSNFVFVPNQSAIYVVGNELTILKLDMITFFLLDTFSLPVLKSRIPVCQDKWSCEEGTKITLLAMMPNNQMVWFCYIHYLKYHQRPPQHLSSRCIVPRIGNMAEPIVQWENPHFNSLDPRQFAHIYNAADSFTYVSAFSPDYVRIFRAQMPDWNGRVNWTGALITDKDPTIIAEPATILLTFETENEVYFLLREKMETCISDCQSWQSQTRITSQKDAARLIRLCKGDRGGLPNVSAGKFGTFAKADLSCRASGDDEFFTYTHVTTAFWDKETQQLFAVFMTETWAPVGSVVCVYDKFNIEAAFDGPISKPHPINSMRSWKNFKNAFVNICERFNSKNLTAVEFSTGFRISSQFPYRSNPVQPKHGRALFMMSGIKWNHLQVHLLPALPKHFDKSLQTTILWLGSDTSLTQLVLYEPGTSGNEPIVCRLQEIIVGRTIRPVGPTTYIGKDIRHVADTLNRLRYNEAGVEDNQLQGNRVFMRNNGNVYMKNEHEEIRQIKVLDFKLFIITDRRLLWFPIAQCSKQTSYAECMRSKNPHCGWSWPDGRCLNGYDRTKNSGDDWLKTFSPSMDRQQQQQPDSSYCPSDLPVQNQPLQTGWSDWFECEWVDEVSNKIHGTCKCRLCLHGLGCRFGMQQTTNCTSQHTNWLNWSNWTRCDMSTSVQTRWRKCVIGKTCLSSAEAQRPCTAEQILADIMKSKDANVLRSKIFLSHKEQSNRNQNNLLVVLVVCFIAFGIGCIISTILFYLWTSNYCFARSPFERNSINTTSYERVHDEDGLRESNTEKIITDNYLRKSHDTSHCEKDDQIHYTTVTKDPEETVLRSQGMFTKLFERGGTPSLVRSNVNTPISSPSTASTIVKDVFFINDPDIPSYCIHINEVNSCIEPKQQLSNVNTTRGFDSGLEFRKANRRLPNIELHSNSKTNLS